MESGKISIIIPAYNAGNYICEAIESALGKGEVIVVDDGSTDWTVPNANNYIGQIKLIRIPHSGLPTARNTAVKAATGEFIIPLDADDKLLDVPSLEPFKDESLGVLYGNYQTNSGVYLKPNQNITEDDLKRNNQLYPTSIIRKSAWDSVEGVSDYGWVDEWYPEDWDMWIKLFQKGWKFKYVDHDMCWHRIHESSLWETVQKDGRHESGKQKMLKRIYG